MLWPWPVTLLYARSSTHHERSLRLSAGSPAACMQCIMWYWQFWSGLLWECRKFLASNIRETAWRYSANWVAEEEEDGVYKECGRRAEKRYFSKNTAWQVYCNQKFETSIVELLIVSNLICYIWPVACNVYLSVKLENLVCFICVCLVIWLFSSTFLIRFLYLSNQYVVA
jgi:hypothetical protein